MAPIIAIAPCRSLPDYVESVRRAGGEPRVLDPTQDQPAAVVGEVQGLLLTGGVDIDPVLYGEERHATVTAIEPERDVFEFALLRAAREARLPIFGICRGLQVMNVAFGGTLVQDIEAQAAGNLPHTVPTPPCAIAHEVWISKGSRLWTLMQEKMVDADTCSVNSRHHQAIKNLAAGFEVTATAPDGVIEAIEYPNATFCLGVQWHPENFWRTGEFRPLFEGFIEACRQ
jgi:putative glutamine amidotransferase